MTTLLAAVCLMRGESCCLAKSQTVDMCGEELIGRDGINTLRGPLSRAGKALILSVKDVFGLSHGCLREIKDRDVSNSDTRSLKNIIKTHDKF